MNFFYLLKNFLATLIIIYIGNASLILLLRKSRIIISNGLVFSDDDKINESKFNILFIETNRYPNESVFDFKQLCAVESAARNNPNAQVKFFTLNSKAQINRDIVNEYKNIQTIRLNSVEFLFEDTSFFEWWKTRQEFILQGN